MEIQTNNLLAELSSWNKQERQFRDLFSEQALKDHSFLRLKLSEYNRLHQKYVTTVTTTDERALLLMLRFQKAKLEKKLYPRLITRLLYRSFNALRQTITAQRDHAKLTRESDKYLNPITTNSFGMSSQIDTPGQENTSKKRHGFDYGRRFDNQKKNGMSV